MDLGDKVVNSMKESTKRGKVLTNLIELDKYHWMSSKFEYLHFLCGHRHEDKLFNVIYQYRCPYCDKNMLVHKDVKDTEYVYKILDDLKFIRDNKDRTKKYDGEMNTVFWVIDGWISALEEIKDLDGTAWILQNNEFIKEIPKWKEKL